MSALTPLPIPVSVVWTVVASGQPNTVTPADPVEVAVAQVHLGLRGETGLRGVEGVGLKGDKGDKGDTGDVTPEAEKARDEAQTARSAAADSADIAANQAAFATTSKTQAEAARDAAFVNANVYASTSAGLAAVADGVQFQVVADDGLSSQRWRRDSASVATAVGVPFPSVAKVDSLGIEAVSDDQEAAFSVVDDDGRRTWIETNRAGEPTDHAASKIGGKLTPVNTPAMLGSEDADSDLNGDGGGFVDEESRRLWLEWDAAGKPTARAALLMLEKLIAAGFSPTPAKYKAVHQATERSIVSGPDIVCWGDSMTAGAGGGGTTYPSVLQSLLTAASYAGTVRNAGVGGETSVTITARSGATPFLVDVSGGVIPSSGGVTIIFRQINGQSVTPLLQGTGTPGTTFTGSLAGVPGTISQSGGNYTFTRTASGSAVAVTRPVAWRTDFSEARRGDIAIIWIGQNGPSNTRAIEDARAIIDHLEALNKRFLVISKPTSSAADDAAWFAEFGRRFLAIRAYMVEYGLQDAGITPTAQDTTDISNGVVPTSLRTDSVHWTAAGYTILGNQVFKRLNELNWI